LSILDTLPVDGNLANTYSGLGTILCYDAKMDSALLVQHKALHLYNELDMKSHAALCQMDIAEVFIKETLFDSALHYLDLARSELHNDENLGQRCIYLGQLARALCGVGRYDEAVSILLEAERIALELENDEYQSRTYELLALVASARGNNASALSYQDKERVALIRDLDIVKTQEITEVRMEGEQEAKAAKAQQLMDTEKRHKRNAVLGVGRLVVLAALALGLYRKSRRTAHAMHVKNQELTRAQDELIRSEKQREASEVRTHIARDVHDQLGSDLTKLAMLGGEVRATAKDDPASMPARAADIERIAGEANRSLSDIVWGVDPQRDTTADLVEQVRTYSESLLKGTGIVYRIDRRHDGDHRPLNPGMKRDLYLLKRGALNNALWYAHADHVDMECILANGHLLLAVADDGAGFDLDRASRMGNGLSSMRARLQRTGGRFLVDSSIGKGTRISLKLELPN